MLDRVHAFLEGTTRLGAILAGYALLGLALAICAEIALRRLANFSLQGVDEVGGYVLAGISGFAFAFGLMQRAHTRIDIVLRLMPAWGQATLNLLAAVIFAGIAVFMAVRAHATLDRSLQLGSLASTPLQTPLWIPQTIWLVGLTLFAVVAVFLAFRAVVAVFEGTRAVNAIAGPPTLQEEIDAERSDRP
ncbi:MAG: TRAP transporter small permease [Geminicoccaceae bacterium]|nr:MAG: TRAP transporter small permease [Geminicoccaceae bacterium]